MCRTQSDTRYCQVCNKEFQVKSYNHKYCSIECRNEYYNAVKRNHFKEERTCRYCGKKFITTHPRYHNCSEECSYKHKRNREKINRRTYIKENGEYDTHIHIDYILKRDKGRCHICGDKVDMSDVNDCMNYGSVDHIIPLSKGGRHIESNVKLAHLWCNSAKSDNDYSLESMELIREKRLAKIKELETDNNNKNIHI